MSSGYARVLYTLTRVELLILDDLGLEPLDAGARHDIIGGPADAILDLRNRPGQAKVHSTTPSTE